MGRVDNDSFLSVLTRYFTRSKSSGTVYITMKRYTGQTKPKPRNSKDEAEGGAGDQKMCLVRATLNKKKISTIAYANLLKAHMDGLKKPERTKTKKDKKST